MKILVAGINIKINFYHGKRDIYDNKLEKHVKIPISTDCEIKNENTDSKIGYGVAICSENDNFEYEKGRRISLKRALDSTLLSRSERSIVWSTYLKNRKA